MHTPGQEGIRSQHSAWVFQSLGEEQQGVPTRSTSPRTTAQIHNWTTTAAYHWPHLRESSSGLASPPPCIATDQNFPTIHGEHVVVDVQGKVPSKTRLH